jgi:hypothetical protein
MTKAASARMQIGVSQTAGTTEIAGVTAMTVQHDEGLAAEHRAAMEILTESTGMDAPGARSDGRLTAIIGGPAAKHGTAGQVTPSWTAVAVDAAERMGPLMGNDHDADDRH